MATTGAVIYVKPRVAATVSPTRSGGVVIYLAHRVVSGIFTTGSGVSSQETQRSLKAWLPSAKVPVVDPKTGLMAAQWYRFFNYLCEKKLGGVNAPAVADIVTSVESAQAAVTSTVSAITSLAEVTNQNATSLAAAREVAVNNSLTGATQIPSPRQVDTVIP